MKNRFVKYIIVKLETAQISQRTNYVNVTMKLVWEQK